MHKKQTNQLRIIGGKWRGRKLTFPDAEGLRPTPDRVRETLFNWLSPHIVGARCLDLFAGSGALGFEALSRGAHSVYMIDSAPTVVEHLKKNAAWLSIPSTDLQIYCADVLNEKNLPPGPFDIVFLDPPFHRNMATRCCTYLKALNMLSNHALVYLEAESELSQLPPTEEWEVVRHKTAGQVGSWLYRSPL
ncbi:MAG: rsmD [Gammaproteobacteria bacterium]|jgi:16S rRNA (guanine966-N2)-methyltransferase|nr:rsmD [Gammaproteobacteria bacterium]